jgi:hypothetical protein
MILFDIWSGPGAVLQELLKIASLISFDSIFGKRIIEEVSSAFTENPTIIRVGPTGPVEDAYYKKSWLRTLGVLGN